MSTFRVHLISGLEFEVVSTGSSVKDLKEAIEKARQIPTYDQALVVDGVELRNVDKVAPENDILLVLGSQLKNFVRDFMLETQNVRRWRSLWSRQAQSALDPEDLLQSCVQAARRMHSVGYESEFVRPFVTEESIEEYLGRRVTCEMALQSEDARNSNFTDPYDQDVLALSSDGDHIPMKAMLDYREKCWNSMTTLSVEDAQRISKQRDALVLDRVEQQALQNWENSCGSVPVGARLLAQERGNVITEENGSGWRRLLRASSNVRRICEPGLPQPRAVVSVNCNDLGSVLVCGVPGGPNIPRVPDGNYGWISWSGTLQQMQSGEVNWSVDGWRRVVKEINLDTDVEISKCSFMFLEPVMGSQAMQRKMISKSLMDLGVEAIGFVLCLSMLGSQYGKTGMFVDLGSASTIIAPVFEGFLLMDATTSVGRIHEQAALMKHLEQTLLQCPVDARLHLRRNIVLYGAQSASWKNLQHTTSSWRGITGISRLFGRTEGEGWGETTIVENDNLYQSLSQLIFTNKHFQAIFVSRQQYGKEGLNAITRICL